MAKSPTVNISPSLAARMADALNPKGAKRKVPRNRGGFTKDATNPRKPKTRGLPPDLEGMNDDRAAWFEAAVVTFAEETGADRNDEGQDDAFQDMLSDMFHWCDRYGVDAEKAIDKARRCYREETMPDPFKEKRK